MKITVITINLNNRSGLLKTIESVANQTFRDFQYIVIDGGSSDGSVDEIKKFEDRIAYWVSEPDKGIYNAMNKSILKAEGEYVLFLNSGDYFYEKDTLQKAIPYLEGDDIIWGNLVVKKVPSHSSEEKIVKYDFTPNKKFWLKNHLPHPATFTKKNLFIKCSSFDESYKIVGDQALFIKMIHKCKASYKHIPIIISVFQAGGISSNSLSIGVKKCEKAKALISTFPFFIMAYWLFISGVFFKFVNKIIPPSSKRRNFLKRIKLNFIYWCTKYKYDRTGIDKAMNNLERHVKPLREYRSERLIISLTSIPERINELHFSLYSLFNQSVLPDKIILWLGEEQFPELKKCLPKKVLAFCDFGLEIKFCHDIKSFKKLIPSLRLFPNDLIVTADDDIYYPKDWLQKLHSAYIKEPEYIHCHRGSRIIFDYEGKIIPYRQWEKIGKDASLSNFFTSGGGIICKKEFFTDVIYNENIFMNICPTADDIWFWACAVSNSTKIKVVPANHNEVISINIYRDLGLSKKMRLYDVNVKGGKNDEQIKKVVDYFNLENILRKD